MSLKHERQTRFIAPNFLAEAESIRAGLPVHNRKLLDDETVRTLKLALLRAWMEDVNERRMLSQADIGSRCMVTRTAVNKWFNEDPPEVEAENLWLLAGVEKPFARFITSRTTYMSAIRRTLAWVRSAVLGFEHDRMLRREEFEYLYYHLRSADAAKLDAHAAVDQLPDFLFHWFRKPSPDELQRLKKEWGNAMKLFFLKTGDPYDLRY